MAFSGHSDEHHPTAATDSPALGTEPADERGEQWHGLHSSAQHPHEPLRQPGGVQRTITNEIGADQHL